MKTFLFLLLVVGIVAGALYFKHSSDSGLKSLNPKELADLIDKSENYRAAFFHEKKFISRVDHKNFTSYEDDALVTAYIYEKGVLKRYSSKELSIVEERVISVPDYPSWLAYYFSKQEDYYKFFSYIRKSGGTDLNLSQMKQFTVQYNSYPGVKYLNCIFIDYGFESIANMYLIPIIKCEKLKL